MGLVYSGSSQQVSPSLKSRSGRKGVSDPSIKFVYGAAVGQLHADIASAVRPGEPARNRRPSIKPTVRQYKPLGGREHTRPSSARFIALIYTLHWWIPHKCPIRIAGLKPHPQCHSSLSLACTSAKKVILCYYFFLNHGMKASISKFHFQFSHSISVFLTFLLPIFVERWEQGQEMTKAGFKLESPK